MEFFSWTKIFVILQTLAGGGGGDLPVPNPDHHQGRHTVSCSSSWSSSSHTATINGKVIRNEKKVSGGGTACRPDLFAGQKI